MNSLDDVQNKHIRSNIPAFRAGDTVRVLVKIVEMEKGQRKERARPQAFEGIVIRRHNAGVSSTFTIRKISYGVGVERIFPVHSPRLEKIEVLDKGRVRRARLFYLRSRRGKAARIRSLIRR
jgi:large subunit ribosomal protein L19